MNLATSIMAYGVEVNITLKTYENGRMAVCLVENDGAPFGTFSVNLPEQPLGENEFFAKTWSENEPMRAPMLATGLFTDTGRRVQTGFATAEVWRFAFDTAELMQ